MTIEVLKERGVGLAAPKVHIGDLKVTPNCFPQPRRYHDRDDQKPLLGSRGEEKGRTVTEVILDAAVVGEESHRIVLCHIFRVLLHKLHVSGVGGKRGEI